MSFIQTYFLCPTSEFIHPPPHGTLRLGSVIRSTSAPQSPLNRGNEVAVVNENPPVEETGWHKTTSAETALGLGVYAQFLQLVIPGLGTALDVEYSRRKTHVFAFDTVTTLSFEPTPGYIEQAVKAPTVQAWLNEPRQLYSPGVSLYLVTGIKVVKGANVRFSTSGGTSVTGNVGIDVAALATVGPKGHWGLSKDNETSFNRSSEFIFAFRVKKLKFRVGRRLQAEDYSRGAFLSTGTDDSEDGLVLDQDEEIDGANLESVTVVPDLNESGKVFCAIP